MGILNFIKRDLRGRDIDKSVGDSNVDEFVEDIKAQIHAHNMEVDLAIKECREADNKYKENGDIDSVVLVYKKHFKEQPSWNAINYELKLARYLIKAGNFTEAWAYLNKISMWTMKDGDLFAYYDHMHKIRFEQFRILRIEKRYKDAFVNIVESYVYKGLSTDGKYFNKRKFVADAKSVANKAGLTEAELISFADELERGIKISRIQEDEVNMLCIKLLEK